MNRLYINIILSVFIAAIATFSACSTNVTDPVSAAEEAFNRKDYEKSLTLCDDIISSDSFNNMSVNDLCRLSVLLVHLSDNTADNSAFALATRCMQTALAANSDSVDLYVQTLTPDERTSAMILRQLSRAIDSESEGLSIPEFEPCDSLDFPEDFHNEEQQ